jgi:Kef-type K+ transport system membrane component KefB/voltage-gated potassium channel Kch
LGAVQVAVMGWLFSAIGIWLDFAPRLAIVAGFGLALSSTAFVLQMLAERHQLVSQEGRVCFGVLLLQDLAVVPLLAMVSIFAPVSGKVSIDIGLALLEGVGALVLVIFIGRFAVRPVLRHIASANNSEVFAATALVLALGTGWIMEQAGLSMALGAFLAGVLLSDYDFRHQITADIEHFRGLLLGLFFMAVGMSLDLHLLVAKPFVVLGSVVALLAVKVLVFYPLARLFKVHPRQALHASFYLSQAGEFGFVLFGQALSSGLFSFEQFSLLVLVVTTSMLATPLMFSAAKYIGQYFPTEPVPDEIRAEHAHPAKGVVLVAGFGRFGHRVGTVLQASGIPFIGVDFNTARVIKARDEGLPVYYGDASQASVLQHLGADQAALAVVTLDQTQAAEKTVYALRRQCPNVPIYARSRSDEDSLVLHSQGVEAAVPETLESSLQLAAAVLRRLGVDEVRIGELVSAFREQDYKRFRARSDASRSER